MKMKQRLLSGLMAALMVAALGVTAFAASDRFESVPPDTTAAAQEPAVADENTQDATPPAGDRTEQAVANPRTGVINDHTNLLTWITVGFVVIAGLFIIWLLGSAIGNNKAGHSH